MTDHETNLNSVAEIAGAIDEVAADETGETLTLITSGGVYCSQICIDRIIWSSECDEREQTPEGGHTETISEYMLRELEKFGNDILKTVKRVREIGE
jgi:hypothetical protein